MRWGGTAKFRGGGRQVRSGFESKGRLIQVGLPEVLPRDLYQVEPTR